EDWVRPGRPATDEEMSYFIREYEEEYKTGNFSTLDDVIIGLKSMQNIQEIVQK
ncbi:MAG: hypothetical protein QG635_932, partial [Bacteroidota bacterium]|nr:hypothetical protein [Bacteroidota bacterium]